MKRHLYSLRHTTVVPGLIGQLHPISLIEVLPGDSFQGSIHSLIRFQAVKKPVMTNIDAQQFWFYVPYRMLWPGWETFITQRSGTPPTLSMSNATSGLKTDGTVINEATGVYMLLGAVDKARAVSAFPFYALRSIYNEFFKDEDDDDVDAWWAPGSATDVAVKALVGGRRHQLFTELRAAQAQGDYPEIAVASNKFSIEKVRDALRVMRLQERREAYGDRYFDVLRSYGVRTNFEMLERPEYLGGSRHRVSFTDVVATGASTGVSVGDIAGHAITGVRHRMRRKSFREHGLVIGLLMLRPRPVHEYFGWPGRDKSAHDDFWAPEYDFQTPQGWNQYFRQSDTIGSGGDNIVGYLPKFQEYRKLPDVLAFTKRGDSDSVLTEYVANFQGGSLNGIRKEIPGNYDDLFVTGDKDWHFFAQNYVGLKSYRLVARHAR